eukprot:scaffold179627_cov21-Tisochrysis_lutea.AAC.2
MVWGSWSCLLASFALACTTAAFLGRHSLAAMSLCCAMLPIYSSSVAVLPSAAPEASPQCCAMLPTCCLAQHRGRATALRGAVLEKAAKKAA